MTKKRLIPFILSIIIIIGISLLLINPFHSNTNIQQLIEKSLTNQYNENIQIEIFDTLEIFNYKLIGFTIAGTEKCSFAVLEHEGESRYKIIRLDKYEKLLARGLDIYVQHIDLYDEKMELKNYLIILSMNAELSKIEKNINGKNPIYYNISSSPSMTLLEYTNESEIQYNFYDYLGGQIK